ncbi:MAG: site-specific integrase [Bacteroidales bacterium]|nr:site-specific integrase [Bacteroidales bacterium]
MIGVTTAIILDTRKKRKDETYTVKLRVTYNRMQKYYPLGVHLTPEEWEKTLQPNPRGDNKDNKVFFNKIEHRAIEVIKELEPFSFQAFEKKFNQKAAPKKDVFYLLQEYSGELTKQERLTTAESYRSTLKSFKEFIKDTRKTKLMLADITPEWLSKYEKWMVENESSITTIGIYLRNLRTIINKAIEEGNLSNEFYPFGKRKYQIPSGKNIKKALTLNDIKKIVEYKTATPAEDKAKDLWLFSYLCNGANVKDIVKLQYRNINHKNITFIRSKTERATKSNQKPIVVMLLPEIRAIMDKWGVTSKEPENYVFGIISETDSPQTVLAKIKQATKTINKYMKRIGESLGFDLVLTTYSARHSFATVLKRSGAPIEFISESLGHKDLRTTENYLDSFEDDVKESFQKKLLDFNNK